MRDYCLRNILTGRNCALGAVPFVYLVNKRAMFGQKDHVENYTKLVNPGEVEWWNAAAKLIWAKQVAVITAAEVD